MMDSLIERTRELDYEAIQAKGRVLFWIYATEWLTVTGTFLLAGVTLHALMIRRRLYKTPGGTRFGRS